MPKPAAPEPPNPPAAPPGGPGSRATGADAARQRLLDVALRLFAEQGFAKTSIRQIAQAAGTNVASVSYYFGHKAGLYRAVYLCGGGPPSSDEAPPGSLDALFRRILTPLRSGAASRAWVQLQRREMFEPSGLWREKVDLGVRPLHDALVKLLCERLGIGAPDDDVQALATLAIAPAVHLVINREVIDILAPQLFAGEGALDAWCERLVRNAELLIADDRRARRKRLPAGERPAPASVLLSPAVPAPHRPPRSRA